MGLSGMAYGAAQSLEEILGQQMLKAKLAQQQAQQQQEMEIERQRLNETMRVNGENEKFRQSQVELGERTRRDKNNQQGLELMQADKAAMDTDAALAGLPPRLRQVVDMRRLGVTGISPQDLNTPEEAAAADKAKQDAEFAEWKRKQDYSENLTRTRPVKADAPTTTPGKLPVGMATSIAAAKTSLDALDRLEALYSDDKVGPVAGRYNKIERGAPQMIGGLLPDAPKDFEEFAAESATLKNQVIQAITGAAVGVKEQERIMGQIPDVTNNPSVWKARAKATRRNLRALTANQTQMGTGAAEAAPGATVDTPESSFSVKAPNGKTYTFNSAEALAAFKAKAGLQ